MDGSLDDFSHTQSTPENTIIITLEESHVKLKAKVMSLSDVLQICIGKIVFQIIPCKVSVDFRIDI